jgi:hypothetical protein
MEQEKPNMTFFHFKFLLTIVVLKKQKKKKIKKKKKKNTILEQNMGRVGLALLLVKAAYLPTFIALDTQNC